MIFLLAVWIYGWYYLFYNRNRKENSPITVSVGIMFNATVIII